MNIRMNTRLLPVFARALLVTACASASTVFAEDIDLFLNNTSNSVRPNVLLVLDNGASSSASITLLDGTKGAKLTLMRQVLNIVADPLKAPYFPDCTISGDTRTPAGCTTRDEADKLVSSINLGLMLINPSTASTNGGYVRYHVRPMNDASNRTALWDEVSPEIPKTNNSPYAKLMHEAYLYFGGKPFYAGFTSKSPQPDDQEAKDGIHYRSPINDYCQSNYLLFLGTGEPESAEEKDSQALLNGLGGVLSSDPIRFSPDNLQSSWFDEYARTLKKQDVSSVEGIQNITTYTIAIQSPEDNNFNTPKLKSSRALLQSAALAGGGEFALGQDGAAVLKAFFEALRKMQPVNSVFAAITLPVSVNVRGTFLNQVYMGQFRPDQNARPRWPGNLKQYQVALDSNDNPVLADRYGKAVEDTVNGFLLPDKTSFWTQNTAYWGFAGLPVSDAPDGSVVEKGGAAQRLRKDFATSQASRNLYTCIGSCGSPGTPLSSKVFADANASITASSLGVADAAERTALINWVRGADNKDDENQNLDLTDSRAYIHGDLLHSRPAVVNYNRTTGDRDVMVYYGSNDGIFRGVKGGQDDADGGEKWGMIFPDFFNKLKILRDNDTVIAPGTPKPYFADGAVSVYQNDVNKDGKLVAADGDKVYLYISMRRGGRFAYALDVSDPDTPKFLWKIDSTMSDFAGLGQTWSSLRPTSIKAVTGDPVVIFGGGYDPVNEDPSPALASNTMGQGIFVVNGRTGALIKHIAPAGMGSMPADLTVLDREGDGKADRIYAPDTKGNVWRVDIDDVEPSKWAAYQIASLGGTGADGRKFLNKIDVVYGKTFDAVLVGSGDREHPTATGVVDRFYMLMDTNIGKTGGLFCGTAPLATCTHANLTDVTNNPYQTGSLPAGSNGWYLTFATGEKLVSSPVTVFSTVIFGTNLPAASKPGMCGNLGEARLYQIGFKTGNAVQDANADGVVDANDRFDVLKGGGYPPSPVYSPVTIDGKRRDVVCVGTRCFKPGGANFDTTRRRTYWYTKQ